MRVVKFVIGVVVATIALTMVVSCGRNSGTGFFGDFNGRLNIETSNVAEAQRNARVIIEEGHQGQLEKESSNFPRKVLGIFPRKAEAVMTFRVPAAQFDAAMADLDSKGVGTVVDREVNDRDDIERRGDLSEIVELLDDRLIGALEGEDGDTEAVEAQQKLAELAETANFPVLVVDLHPSRGPLDWLAWLLLTRGLWIAVALAFGYVWGQRSASPKTPPESPVIGPDDPRQNAPEKNPGVQDWGATT